MDPAALARELAAISGRGACTDAERRAARLLARELRQRGRAPRSETVWVRPAWAPIWLLYAALGVAGSVVSVDHPIVATALVGVAALGALLDLGGRVRALSILAPKRATQNVVAEGEPEGSRRRERPALWGPEAGRAGAASGRKASEGPAVEDPAGAAGARPVRLIITAGYDAAPIIPPTSRALGRGYASFSRLLGGRFPSPLGLLTFFLILLAALCGLRIAGEESAALGAVQLLPTIGCILAVALLAELTFATPGTGANANATAAAAALALLDALDRSPPRNLDVEVVLAGAAAPGALGFRAHLRGRRKRTRAEEVAVVHFEATGVGTPAYWIVDGPLFPTRLHPELARHAADAAASEQHLHAKPHRGHGLTGAMQARRARWPAIAIGALDRRAEAPPEEAEDAPRKASVELALQLVRNLDRRLGEHAAGR